MSDFTPKLPEVKFNRNGYEIRTEILDMAKSLMMEEYHAKFHGWEISAQRDEKTGTVVTTVEMPKFPGLEQVLATAEKMYAFVNAGARK
jgi:hypothetical protein